VLFSLIWVCLSAWLCMCFKCLQLLCCRWPVAEDSLDCVCCGELKKINTRERDLRHVSVATWKESMGHMPGYVSADLGSTTIQTLWNTFSVCFRLPGVPDGQGLHLGDYSMDSIAPGKINQAPRMYLKLNNVLFEPRSLCRSGYRGFSSRHTATPQLSGGNWPHVC
jgi:hypothetical protein